MIFLAREVDSEFSILRSDHISQRWLAFQMLGPLSTVWINMASRSKRCTIGLRSRVRSRLLSVVLYSLSRTLGTPSLVLGSEKRFGCRRVHIMAVVTREFVARSYAVLLILVVDFSGDSQMVSFRCTSGQGEMTTWLFVTGFYLVRWGVSAGDSCPLIRFDGKSVQRRTIRTVPG
jgi:hypothetical protein